MSTTDIFFDNKFFGRVVGAGMSSVEAWDEVGGVGGSRVPHAKGLRPASERFGDGVRARARRLGCAAALCTKVGVCLRSKFSANKGALASRR